MSTHLITQCARETQRNVLQWCKLLYAIIRYFLSIHQDFNHLARVLPKRNGLKEKKAFMLGKHVKLLWYLSHAGVMTDTYLADNHHFSCGCLGDHFSWAFSVLLEKGGPTTAVLFFFPPAEGITSCWYICIWEISFLIGCNGFSIWHGPFQLRENYLK